MIDFDIKLTRRRVLASILVIGLAAAAAGVGTFALFSDTSTSDTNQITAGEMTLTVDDGFTADDLYPTQTTGNQTIPLTYSDGPAANLSIETVETQNASLDWAGNLGVNAAYVEVDDTVEYTFDSATDLSDLQENNVVTINETTSIDFIVDLRLEESADNDFQGQSVNISVTFNATQQSS